MTTRKVYVGYIRDRSVSMRGITPAAARDYNSIIQSIAKSSHANGIDTIVSVVDCGISDSYPGIARAIVNSSVNALKPMAEREYTAVGGHTPLFDSVGELIDIFKSLPDANEPHVSFIIVATTDGGENSSRKWKHLLADEMRRLMLTDRWTFVFRVPDAYSRTLQQLGVPAGNIHGWEQTEQGVQASTEVTTKSFDNYYSGVARGVTSSKAFFTNIDKAKARQVIKTKLKDISDEVKVWNVSQMENDMQIRDYIAKKGVPFQKGAAFYQLMKPEKQVQDYKKIVIKDKKKGKVYAGAAARSLLGLPEFGTVKVAPGDHAGYDIYIQSTSVNRKLPAGSRVMYWPGAIK